MTDISHLLEDFGRMPGADATARMISEEAWEEQRLAGFEQGYSAGWEDAVAARDHDRDRITSALAQRLEDMSFTYHEALTQMTAAMAPVFEAIVGKVLPEAMAMSFAHRIVEQVQAMAQAAAAAPVVLTVPQGAAATLRPVLDRDLPFPAELCEDPALDPGQAFIRLGEEERMIDGQRLVDEIAAEIDRFMYPTNKETRHG